MGVVPNSRKKYLKNKLGPLTRKNKDLLVVTISAVFALGFLERHGRQQQQQQQHVTVRKDNTAARAVSNHWYASMLGNKDIEIN